MITAVRLLWFWFYIAPLIITLGPYIMSVNLSFCNHFLLLSRYVEKKNTINLNYCTFCINLVFCSDCFGCDVCLLLCCFTLFFGYFFCLCIIVSTSQLNDLSQRHEYIHWEKTVILGNDNQWVAWPYNACCKKRCWLTDGQLICRSW